MLEKYRVTMEDGTSYEVTADQRDNAAWEVQPFGCSVSDSFAKIFTYSRFCAWNAARRQKLHTLTWAQFSEQCVEVRGAEAEAEPEGEDPGKTVASAVTSSS